MANGHSKAFVKGTPPNSASGVCGATVASSSAACPETAYFQRFPGSPATELAKPRCRPKALLPCRTHVRFNEKTTADRRRRSTDRLRNPRRVRSRARWENGAELRDPPPHEQHPGCPLKPAAAGSRSTLPTASVVPGGRVVTALNDEKPP